MKPLLSLIVACVLLVGPVSADESPEPVVSYVVVHGTDWCEPCQRVKKIADQLKKEGHAVFLINPEKDPAKARTYGFLFGKGYPQVVFVEKRHIRRRYLGFVPEYIFRYFFKKLEN